MAEPPIKDFASILSPSVFRSDDQHEGVPIDAKLGVITSAAPLIVELDGGQQVQADWLEEVNETMIGNPRVLTFRVGTQTLIAGVIRTGLES